MPVIPSELTLRRHADDAGYRLMKNPSRNPGHPSFGGYQLASHDHGGVDCGHGPFGYSADLPEVAEFLKGPAS
jgi:hypothetical protein